MIDPKLTGFLRRSARLASSPTEATKSEGAGIRARLTATISEVEAWPTADERLPMLLLRLRALTQRQLEPLLLQSGLLDELEAAIEAAAQ